MLKSCFLWSEVKHSLGVCCDLFRSLDAKSAVSDERDRYFPAFATCMLEVLGRGEQRAVVFVGGLFDLRKEKMDGALIVTEDLVGDGT